MNEGEKLKMKRIEKNRDQIRENKRKKKRE